jgi:membrane protease YdiL (CAAX protease family)
MGDLSRAAGSGRLQRRHQSIGLGRDGIGPDGRSVAWRAMGVIIAVIVGVSLFPAGREFFTDDRVLGMSGWELAYEMAFRIPFVTAGFEELAFRGVLLGLLTALWGAKRAIVASSVLFGVWHVLPTLSDQSSNAVGEDVPIWVGIATTMVVTFLAGLVLCRLRAAGRGIPAPIVAHATLNGTALLVAYLVTT